MPRTARIALAAMLLVAASLASAKPWAWVWYPGQWQRPPGLYFARLKFDIDADVTAAYAFYTGDNFLGLYLNGKLVGGSGDWYTLKPLTIQTLGPLLRKGTNVLAVRVQNDDYEGGFALKGLILLSNGRRIELNSNDSWRCANKADAGWEQVDFDDSEWVPSEEIGTPPAGGA